MEEFIMKIAETSLIGAAFLYMLKYVIKNMEVISDSMKQMAKVMQQISDTLIKVDMRVERLEERIRIMEGRD